MVQAGGIVSRETRLRISSDRLLLVEGKDEVNLLSALLQKRCPGDTSDICVIDAGGKNKFPSTLMAIRIEAVTRTTLQSIVVIRDADENPSGAFESVCTHLRNADYLPPESHGTFSSGTPSIGVFIVPDGMNNGAIETLCRKSVENTATEDCVREYLDCLEEHGVLESGNNDKSLAHAYLAATRDPVARVGEGAHKGVWNFYSEAFDDLVNFLSGL